MTLIRTLGFPALGCALGLTCAAHAQAVTPYRELALDCGGWVSGFAQHPGGRLYGFGDIFGLYRSDDFGANWKFLQSSITENVTFALGVTVHPLDANRVAFMGFRTAWTSTDGGDTWTKRLGDLNQTSNTRGTSPILYHPTQANELWMASPRTGQTGTLWRSVDNGSTWSAPGGAAFSNEEATTIHFPPAAPLKFGLGPAPSLTLAPPVVSGAPPMAARRGPRSGTTGVRRLNITERRKCIASPATPRVSPYLPPIPVCSR